MSFGSYYHDKARQLQAALDAERKRATALADRVAELERAIDLLVNSDTQADLRAALAIRNRRPE